MCFVWIWEQTAIISLYSINWLVFITETECVYCAVRTGSLYITLHCAHTVFMCFVWIWEKTAIISLYNINWLVFITETECVYCAVRTGYLNIIQYNIFLVGLSDEVKVRVVAEISTQILTLTQPLHNRTVWMPRPSALISKNKNHFRLKNSRKIILTKI